MSNWRGEQVKDKVPGDESFTHFLNIDVDIWSASDLQPLIDALGKQIAVHYAGSTRGRFEAHFSLIHIERDPKSKRRGGHSYLTDDFDMTADRFIRKLSALIRALPPKTRKLWNAAKSRDFNIGIQGGITPRFHEIPLKPETLQLIADMNGRMVITIYACPEAKPKPNKK